MSEWRSNAKPWPQRGVLTEKDVKASMERQAAKNRISRLEESLMEAEKEFLGMATDFARRLDRDDCPPTSKEESMMVEAYRKMMKAESDLHEAAGSS